MTSSSQALACSSAKPTDLKNGTERRVKSQRMIFCSLRMFAVAVLSAVASGEPPSHADDAPRQPEHADYVEHIRGTGITIEMVWVPEGRFWIGKTEITWDQYLPYCAFDDPDSAVPPDADAVSKPSKPLDVLPYDRGWGKGSRPAVGMSWNAAKHYCQWLSINTGRSYTLPTEAEWELACGPRPEGPLTQWAWCAENSGQMTHEVGQLQPNARGLYDMLGNLWEYCANPFAPDQPDRAVLRGGSWREPAREITPKKRLRFNNDWTLDDPSMPPGVWWVPDGDHLGFRIIRHADDALEPAP